MDLWNWLAEHINQEGAVIKQAPLAFVTFFSLGAVIAWRMLKSYYAERFTVMEQRIADYQERLGLVPPDRSAYSKLNNRELKIEVANMVTKLREFHHEYILSRPDYFEAERQELMNVQGEEQRRLIIQRYQDMQIQGYTQWHSKILAKYQKEFQAKAIALHDELLRRLPPDKAGRPHNVFYNGNLAGHSPINDIATDLERLSTLLP
jgi:hypothetical protein